MVDLEIKHGMTESAMNDLVLVMKGHYKCLKTITANLREDSGINSCIRRLHICSTPMCFCDDSVMTCSICDAERIPTEYVDTMQISRTTLAPRLQDWLENKAKCEKLCQNMSSTESPCEDHVRECF